MKQTKAKKYLTEHTSAYAYISQVISNSTVMWLTPQYCKLCCMHRKNYLKRKLKLHNQDQKKKKKDKF